MYIMFAKQWVLHPKQAFWRTGICMKRCNEQISATERTAAADAYHTKTSATYARAYHAAFQLLKVLRSTTIPSPVSCKLSCKLVLQETWLVSPVLCLAMRSSRQPVREHAQLQAQVLPKLLISGPLSHPQHHSSNHVSAAALSVLVCLYIFYAPQMQQCVTDLVCNTVGSQALHTAVHAFAFAANCVPSAAATHHEIVSAIKKKCCCV
jgi:hypothetical protein